MKKYILPAVLLFLGVALYVYGNNIWQNEIKQQGSQSSTVANLKFIGGILMISGAAVAFWHFLDDNPKFNI